MSAEPLRVLVLSNMYPGPDDPDYGSFVARMTHAMRSTGAEVEVAAIDSRASGWAHTPAKYTRLARQAAGLARRADVIHAHYLFPTGAIAAGCHRTRGVPWVVTAHGQDVQNLSRPTVRWASARALRSASSVIVVSRHLATKLRATGLPLPPVHTINMGVDLDRFAPRDRAAARARLRLAPHGPLVLAVGGLTERKNPLTLLQAFARLRDQDPRARLAFVGAGPMKRPIEAGIERLRLDNAVVLAGAVAPDDVAEWMAAADALALVSRVEPLGVVALEALASGRPVVATRVGGAAEIVPDRGPGRVVDPGNPGAIASALADLIRNPPGAQECRRASEGYGVQRQARRVLAALRTAVDQAGERPRRPRW